MWSSRRPILSCSRRWANKVTRLPLVALSFALAASAAAKDLIVAEDGSGDFKTIAKALKAAQPGDVVVMKKAAGFVGMELKEAGGKIVVVRAVKGSPAETAGIKKDDRIIAIDGIETTGRSLAEVVGRSRGPYGAPVALQVDDGTGPREVTIVRGRMRYEIKGDLDKMWTASALDDFETVVEYAKPLAEGGVAAAQTVLAFGYFHGTGIKKDMAKAFAWASKAAESGDVSSQRMLGIIFQGNEGTTQNLPLAVYWCRKAAEKGDAYAALNLAGLHEKGSGTPVDKQAAHGLYRHVLTLPGLTSEVTASAQAAIARFENEGVIYKPFAVAAAVAVAPVVPSAPAAKKSDIDELPAAIKPDPTAVALVIGIERYREALPRADFAAADARLAAAYFKRVLGVQDENLALLVDDRATRTDLAKYIEQWLPNHAEKDGKVYIYFSGHGAPDPAKGDSYLVPYDGDPAYIKQTGYSVKSLYAQLAKLPVKSVVVVMDSCFSGAGGRSVMAKGARPLVSVKTDIVPAKVTVISASAGDQISNSYQEEGHGLFTYFLLKGLKEKGDFKGAYDYLGPEVARVARRRYNSDQTPQWREGK